MSQGGILSSAIIPPGAGILTLTGNDAAAVGPDGGGNLDLLGAGGLTVTNTAANTLTITNPAGVEYTIQTLDATVTSIRSIPIAVNSAITVTATVVGARDDFSASLWGEVIFGARRDAGAAVAVQIPINTAIGEDSTGAATITADVNGNNLRILVTGVVAQTWNWTATTSIIEQT